MGFFQRVQSFLNISRRSSDASLINPSWLFDIFHSNPSGEAVNEKRAMRISTVWICQLILAETLSSLTWNVHRKVDKGNEIARQHPVQFIFRNGPNAYMTFTDFMRALIWHASGYGAGFAEIIRNEYREVVEFKLWDEPSSVQVLKDPSGKPHYNYKGKPYDAEDLLIIKRFTLDGVTPLSPIRFNAETLGFAIKQQKFRGSTYGSKPPGYLTSDMPITGKEQLDAVQEYGRSFKRATLETGEIPVLYGGLKFNPVSFSPADLQLLDMTEATKEDIYGMFRIPPVFAQNYKRATFDNAEKQDLLLGKYTLTPWVTAIQEEFKKKCFRADESDFYVNGNMNSLLRADYKTRTEGYQKLWQLGAMTANQICELEGWNPIDGGDRAYVPMNYMPVDLVDDVMKRLTTPATTQTRSKEEDEDPIKKLLNGITINGHQHLDA